jgi:4-amino-4-deoxy-L-arabinose transferase-like glycosyltransferase
LVLYFPVFLHLEKPVFRVWDESRIAINTIEMSENGDLLVPHYEGKPDLWNTKPPLLIWTQLAFYKIFGNRELAFRFPSGLSALLTCIGIMLFSLKYMKSYWYGLIASLVLITSNGYIGFHVVRSGDYDSMLTMFMFLYAICFFLFITSGDRRFWFGFLLFMVLSVLTKGIQGLLFLPGLAVYLSFNNRKISNSIRFMTLTFITGIIAATSYYFIREIVHPGYLQVVWENELGGRYLKTLEGNGGSFWYYYNKLIHYRFYSWYWLLPVGSLMGLLFRSKVTRELTIFSIAVIFTYWLIISLSQTKLEWYDAPLYPLMAMLVAIAIYQAFLFIRRLRESRIPHSLHSIFVFHYMFVILLLFFPYQRIMKKFYLHDEKPWDKKLYSLSYRLRKESRKPGLLHGIKYLYDGHRAHLELYVKEVNSNGGRIEHKDYRNLASGDGVILNQQHIYEFISENHEFELLEQDGNLYKLRILRPK